MSSSFDEKKLSDLKTVLGDSFELLTESFKKESAELSQQLEMAIESTDVEKTRGTAHLLKGMAGSVCASYLMELCGRLEQDAIDNKLGNNAQTYEAISNELLLVVSSDLLSN